MTIVCGDSHTCTHGALGAMAWGIGSSELLHVLATQTIQQRRPKRMRVTFDGSVSHGLRPKDLILHLMGKMGAADSSAERRVGKGYVNTIRYWWWADHTQ